MYMYVSSLPPSLSLRQALSGRSQELERLKGEWSSQTAKLSSEHSAQLSAERERALQSQTEAQSRYEKEKREIEQSHNTKVSGTVKPLYNGHPWDRSK